VIAYLDESGRVSPEGLYVVAAAVVMTDQGAARAAAGSVLLPGQRRYHWRNEDEAQRYRMLECMTELELPVRGYVRRSVDPKRLERARALCLRRVLWDLRRDGVDELVIESRHESSDRRDRLTIVRAQQARIASRSLLYEHRQPDGEPILWFADAAAGAIIAAAAGETDAYVERLVGCEIIEVDP